MSNQASLIVYVVSDSSGETATHVTQAALAQFPAHVTHLERLPKVSAISEIAQLVSKMQTSGSLITYTFAQRPYRDALEYEAARCGIPVIDLLGRLIDRVASLTGSTALEQVGRLHQLDEAYFQRMEAVNFAVHHDDGTNPERLREADVILTGVSRTSKTPNCMYLAQHYGYKAANVPLVLNVEPPPTLFQVSRRKVIGLTVDPHILHSLRTTRAKIMGLGTDTEYTELDSIEAEVKHAKKIFRELNCHVLDVSNKAIEETSSEIALVLRRSLREVP